MALTVGQDEGTVTAGGNTTITPGAGKTWNLKLNICTRTPGTNPTDYGFNANVTHLYVEAASSSPGTLHFILNNSNPLILYEQSGNQGDFGYTYFEL